jgi:hypothetical protein
MQLWRCYQQPHTGLRPSAGLLLSGRGGGGKARASCLVTMVLPAAAGRRPNRDCCLQGEAGGASCAVGMLSFAAAAGPRPNRGCCLQGEAGGASCAVGMLSFAAAAGPRPNSDCCLQGEKDDSWGEWDTWITASCLVSMALPTTSPGLRPRRGCCFARGKEKSCQC